MYILYGLNFALGIIFTVMFSVEFAKQQRDVINIISYGVAAGLNLWAFMTNIIK